MRPIVNLTYGAEMSSSVMQISIAFVFASNGAAINNAERNCDEVLPETRTTPPSTSGEMGPICTGGQPPNAPLSVQSTSQPSWRKASVKSWIGRSRMRFVPSRTKEPSGDAARTAASGRIAVPALPRFSSTVAPGAARRAPPTPRIFTAKSPRSSTTTPICGSASSMRSVSSEASTLRTIVSPWHIAAKRSARLESDLLPGSVTTPVTRLMGATVSDASLPACIVSARPRPGASASAASSCSNIIVRDSDRTVTHNTKVVKT
mmetsp:Transcript_24785/g.83308  ORF Transcript_24785/g.83308 Transcript_24785/m.83308 type:complete len:262 (+) Transcript_24785:870-1655(+)